MGNRINYETARFELIESHVDDISLHKVAINYETTEMILVDMIGEYLLLSNAALMEDEPVDTFMVKMQPSLSIVSYQAHMQPQLVENSRF